jgi:hypothetical protein
LDGKMQTRSRDNEVVKSPKTIDLVNCGLALMGKVSPNDKGGDMN